MAEPAEINSTNHGSRAPGAKSPAAFRTIAEVSDELDLPQHVLRFWESKFPQIRPLKRGGGRRYYRPEDIVLLRRIRSLLHDEGYTIRGAQKLLRQKTPASDKPGPEVSPDEPEAMLEPAAEVHDDGDDALRAELKGILDELLACRGLLK
ncbi:MAG: MerR family transcriptional regulator [Rhodospirillales bacterium]|nr:MerR family transcriptional regulator [Rhodospirillales bacterium]